MRDLCDNAPYPSLVCEQQQCCERPDEHAGHRAKALLSGAPEIELLARHANTPRVHTVRLRRRRPHPESRCLRAAILIRRILVATPSPSQLICPGTPADTVSLPLAYAAMRVKKQAARMPGGDESVVAAGSRPNYRHALNRTHGLYSWFCPVPWLVQRQAVSMLVYHLMTLAQNSAA